jgi:hypothetical protein
VWGVAVLVIIAAALFTRIDPTRQLVAEPLAVMPVAQ